MPNINLSKDYVETSANVANQPVSILTATVPDKKLFIIETGTLLRLDLQTSGAAQISKNTDIYLGKKNVSEIFPIVFYEKDYSAYNAINSGDGYSAQLNEENQNELRIDVNTKSGSGRLAFREGEELQLIIDGPDVVDIDNCTVSFKVIEKAFRPNR